ncbi:hypothetical protein M569_01564, partial [Genlisea aurea]
ASKIGLEAWEQPRVQALASVTSAIVKAVRLLPTEEAEPVVMAVISQATEFALSVLENWIGKIDDTTFQNILLQLLQLLLSEEIDKELDFSQSCSLSALVNLLPDVPDKDGDFQWSDHVECLDQGSTCFREKEIDGYLLPALLTECVQVDVMNPQMVRGSSRGNSNMLINLSQHWAVVHMMCIRRLVLICKDLISLPRPFDESCVFNLWRRLSYASKILKLLHRLLKDASYFVPSNAILQATGSLVGALPGLFSTRLEYLNAGPVVENSFESLTVNFLEEVLQVVHTIFTKSYVHNNVQACVASSILQTLDSAPLKSIKNVGSAMIPLANFPRVVMYFLKLCSDVKNQADIFHGLNEISMSCSSVCGVPDIPLCQICNEEVFLLKKYTKEELLGIIFPSSIDWLDNLVQLLAFFHSEGIKIKTVLERSSSFGTKASGTLEAETVVCHEDDALFGDLFSEGARSVESMDGCELSNGTATSFSNFNNMSFQAANEIMIFLKAFVCSPQWHPLLYKDACKKLTSEHIDIFFSVLNCSLCCTEVRSGDTSLSLNEEGKIGHLNQTCYELLQRLVVLRTFSDSLEELVVDKILISESGRHVYNDQMLALLAHILVCRSDSGGSFLRTKVYQLFVEYINQQAKAACSECSTLEDVVESLPSVFHVEIVLIAYHFASREEKSMLANGLLSAIKNIDIPLTSSSSLQLSCWALLISRLLLVLRHIICHPQACPSLLCMDFREKLREAAHSCLLNSSRYLFSWPAMLLEDTTSSKVSSMTLLSQLVDIGPHPVLLFKSDLDFDCLGLAWEEIYGTFSCILGLWDGRKTANLDDLIIQRYIFVLCWDLSFAPSFSRHPNVALSNLKVPETFFMKNLPCANYSILSQVVNNYADTHFPNLVLSMLQQLDDSFICDDIVDLSWDFFRHGSQLLFLLSLIFTGNQEYSSDHSVPLTGIKHAEGNTEDAEFLGLPTSLVHYSYEPDEVAVIIEILSSLLKKYLLVYQRASNSILGSRLYGTDKLFVSWLIEDAGENCSTQNELAGSIRTKESSVDYHYKISLKLGKILCNLSHGYRSKVFWEVTLHGFPLGSDIVGVILPSCMLSIEGIVGAISDLLRMQDIRGINLDAKGIAVAILDTVSIIKYDKVFKSLESQCDFILQSLNGLDLSNLFVLIHMEDFVRSNNTEKDVDRSIHEHVVLKIIDLADILKQDSSKSAVLNSFLSIEDMPDRIKNIYRDRGVFVLIDALDYCHSESVNSRVLAFFVDLLSDGYSEMKLKLRNKFLCMDVLFLSSWLEMRLLGSVTETANVVSTKETSVNLRGTTINFLTCLLTPSPEFQLQELQSHLHAAMLLSLEKAFLLFHLDFAKIFFCFLVQISKDEMLVEALLQKTVPLIDKLVGNELLLPGLRYLLGFFTATMSNFCSPRWTVEKSSGKTVPNSGSGLASISSRALSTRKSADDSLVSPNRGSGSAECDATSIDDDEDDATSDGELGSIDREEEEDNNSERALASKVCTFTSSGSNFMEQHWYFCYTCDLTVSKGCCSVCAKVCHRGHRVVYSRSSRFFCDCGAGGVRGSSCQCLKPRKFSGNSNVSTRVSGNFLSLLAHAENGDQLPESDSDIDEDTSADIDNSSRLFISKEVLDRLPNMLDNLDLEGYILRACLSLLPCIISRTDSEILRDRRITFGEKKVLNYSTDLLLLKKAYKSGSLDLKIKADYSNAKELKSHLMSGSLVKSLLSVSARGRLAVGEGDKVAIFDVGQLIGQATVSPVTADKANVKPLSKNIVRFEIVHLLFNSLVENYLVVAGYEDCHVLTINHRGEIVDRLAIELVLQDSYIRQVSWVPGSQVHLMVVTNKFVKIYDLSQDNISPLHYITVTDDMIVDATLLLASHGRMFLVVLADSGNLYRLEISMKANIGSRPLKEIIEVEGRDKLARGSSLYFSSTHKLLFLSYQNGTTLIGRFDPDVTSVVELSAIFDDDMEGKLSPASLHHWRELVSGSGLLLCFSNLKSNGIVAISFGANELLAQNLRLAGGSTSPLVGVTAYRPLSKDKIHCLLLHEDGSLQIYSHVPAGVDDGVSIMADKVKKLGSGILKNKAFGGLKPEFPLDFFEKTVLITPDVKFSSDAIRNNDSEGAKQTLTSEDGFLEGASSSGFKITVSNSNPDIVMVGLRVQVGNTSAAHIPSEVSIFQRVIKLEEGMRSWYDIPFTVAESLLADEEFTISIGRTFGGTALPRIDSLDVYGRAKDEFGWKEKMDAILEMEARVLGCNSLTTTSARKSRITQSASLQDQVVADGLKLLSVVYSLGKQQGLSKLGELGIDLDSLKCKPVLEAIFESERQRLLQAAAGHVLQSVFPRREVYYQVKDILRLRGVVKCTGSLLSKLDSGDVTASWITEAFTEQMRAVSKIGLHRLPNLATFLDTNGPRIIHGLMEVLWGIFDLEQPDTQTLNNIIVSSVELIYCYAQCLAFSGKDASRESVAPAVSLLKQLLFSANEAVQTSSSLAISSRFLQVPFPKQMISGTDNVMESTTSGSLHMDTTTASSGNNSNVIGEDSITSSVQYCCDGCSTVPILRQRWHCTVCPDFDLCETCYEVLDAERLLPPHSRDHPMTAIPIEVEIFGADGHEIHLSPDDLSHSSLLASSADADLRNSAPSIHELETNESVEFSASILDSVFVSASKRAVNSSLLSELLEQLKGWIDTSSGVQAIPVMQLFYRLSSAVGSPFADNTEVDSLNLEKLIRWFVDEMKINKPFLTQTRSSFGEIVILIFMFLTLMLRNWNQPSAVAGASKSGGTTDSVDKATNRIPASPSVSSSSAFDGLEKSETSSSLQKACNFLRQQAFVNYLMDILQSLVHVFKSYSVIAETHGSNPISGCGVLLTVRKELSAGNYAPFFSDSYTKLHRADVFADYHRLLLENTFRLVYCLIRPEKQDKSGEKEKTYKIYSGKDLKLDAYQDVLCSYINNPNTTFVRRYARRLLLHVCGCKTFYYSIRDAWQFSSEIKKLYKQVSKSGGFQSSFSYERSVKIVKCLSTIADVSAARPRNWQKFCLKHTDILPFLMNGLFYFGEECVFQSLKLIGLAFYTGKDTHTASQKSDVGDGGSNNKLSGQPLDPKKKKKGEEGSESANEKSFMDMEPALVVFTDRGDDSLKVFVDTFLLEWNSTTVRAEAKCVLLGAWYHGKLPFKETVLSILLQKVKHLPLYGQNIIEYTDLVTCLLTKSPESSSRQYGEIVDNCLTSDVIKFIFDTLHSQNELLANHPNSRIYNTLSGLVEFDGYYLESEPCVACSSPEVPYSRMKLESLKSETKFTDNRIIVKCTGSYTIHSVTMNVHDARKSKSVKVLNLYYNNRPVSDLSELKNNWLLWKRAKLCHLAFNQTELKVDFPIPIVACNFMIELDSFYENLQALSLEPLQCPRCSRPVIDKHGICSNCHENAYQCRQCRNINYENLDSFLCNECGYSKYGRFEFNFMAKPSFSFDSMENDEDMKRGLAAIESESENAHRRYQQLLGFKKPLLKIVSSIGETEMDSQQKDSVQQMMVSLPGPSCKINRKIALLGVLYGEKCKAAFDSVSKSVQTLQGLRRVLMNYLHQKNLDNQATPSKFVALRSPNNCYGCASAFVTQCLEILLVLSKHQSSKKQLVASGILQELFENNIHQGPKTARVQARAALCAFSEASENAVVQLNDLLLRKIIYCLEHHRSMDISLATREELMLLSDVCSLSDEFWESRLRVVFQILFKSIKLGAKHPAISEHVILPCLKIVSQACTPPKRDSVDKEPVSGKPAPVSNLKDGNSIIESGSGHVLESRPRTDVLEKKNSNVSSGTQDIQLVSYSEWEKGASYLDFVRRQYRLSQEVRAGPKSRPQRYDYLALKYGLRWKRRCKGGQSETKLFELGSWVTELILSACSQAIRSEMCMLINLLCGHSSSRQFRLLNLLMSLLPATLSTGENAAEYFELLFRMIGPEDARIFLTVQGCLTTICKLIMREVNNVKSLERSLHIDISQGFILHKLIELLGKFLEVPNIRSRFMQDQLLSDVLESLIVIRGLIVQKTKLISDCNCLLKDLLDSLLLESSENKRQFIQACIRGLQIHGEDKNGRSSMFILEQLCNLICPTRPEPVYSLILNKAHTQEEFIRGSMTKNPYSSAEIGPLMRDVKNKICHQLDLLGLIEDDFGMELLVAGNIISLDLSIALVYEQVWKKSNSQTSATVTGAGFIPPATAPTSTRDFPSMTVTYRLQGLDGEATEPMIKELDEEREESQDPEVEFSITGAVREFGGLEILLTMVQHLRDDLKSNQEQLVGVLNLLMMCCKTRENRRALLRLGALSILLETARRAFAVDAMEPAEGILLIVESLTMEANDSDSINLAPGALTISSEDSGSSEQAKKIVLMFLERLSLPSGHKKSSKQQRNTEMVARILPYLTYGESAAMEVLIQHFEPYLKDWSEFDRLQKQCEENPKDETIVQQSAKQKLALENFVRVSESLKASSCGERLKDIILEKGISQVAVRHLKICFPCTSESGYKSSPEWQSGLKLASIPLILSMLRGLSMGHFATQCCIDEEGILPLLHALESVSGENEIGAKAENLLDTLADEEGTEYGFLAEKVNKLRHTTRDEMRRMALKNREQLLQRLGMRQDDGERIIVSHPVLVEGFEDVEEEEEDGLACMVCREGYKLRPTDLLGVYAYSKRVNLGVGTSGNSRADCVYTTVSHFNIIHFQCHNEAKRADAARKNPKKEWDGAALRNNETLCNNLFPVRGPSVPMGQYMRYVDQYWDYLNALGHADGTRLRLMAYDIVLMLARFATGASFSADSRGGGRESNCKFLLVMIQMARHLLEQDSSQRSNLSRAIATYLSSTPEAAKTSASGGSQSPSSGAEETVQYMMSCSLLSDSYESWLKHRRGFLQRGIYHAYMQRHGRPNQRSSAFQRPAAADSGGSNELFSTIQPMLVYIGLIEQLQHYFKVRKSPASDPVQTKATSSSDNDDTRKLEAWEVEMNEKLVNVKEMVGFSKDLLSWLEEMTASADLLESFDIMGTLSDVLGSGYSKCDEFVHASIN